MKIAIFAREPIPGRTKTRLARSIGDEAACALHRAFVLDILARCRAHPALEPEIHGAEPGPFLASLGAPLVAQVSGDLGARMAHALAQGASLVVGTDAPTLPRAILDRAIGALAGHDVVLTPAADGGYVLIGARVDPRFLRGPIRWSSPHALADTIRAARAHDLGISLTAPHPDVDTADDLRVLRAHLVHDRGAAPATAAAIAALWPPPPWLFTGSLVFVTLSRSSMAGADLFARFGRTFDQGAVLFREDEPGDTMFVIQQGQVRITKTGREGPKTLAVLGAGEFFGEMAILNSKPRTATAEAVTPLRVLEIDAKMFSQMIVSNTEIAVRLITKLARRLDSANELIEVLMHRDPKARVILGLSRQAEMVGEPQEDGSVLVPIHRAELAAEIGLTEDETDEVMRRLARLKIVAPTEQGYVVSDVGRLAEFLEFLEMREKFGDA